MNRVPSAASAPAEPAIADGFGHRTLGVDPESGDQVELLHLPSTLVENAGFVTALAERVARFATVRHASYAHLRRLDRPSADRLVLVSDSTAGWRLSDLLDAAARAHAPLEITVVIGLLRQLLPAAALYGRHNRDSAIGALAPERLIVTPQARLVIAEHAFGPALEKLNLGRDRLWRDLRVAMPPSAGLPRANARADANALGVVALSVLIGRVLQLDEYPGHLQALLDATSERHDGQAVPLSPTLSTWLGRALQFDIKNAFQSPHEAQVAFEAVLASDRGYVTKPTALQEWVNKVGGVLDAERKPPQPEPVAVIPEPEPEPEPPPPAPAPDTDWAPRNAPDAVWVPEPVQAPAPPPPPSLWERLETSRPPEPASAREDSGELGRVEPVESAFARENAGELRRDAAEPDEPDQPVPVARVVAPSASSRQDSGVRRDLANLSAGLSAEALAKVGASAKVEAASGREGGPAPPAPSAAGVRSPLVLALLAVAVFQTLVLLWLWNRAPASARAGQGELVVQSRPVAARVSVDGVDRGATPLTMALPAGAHVLEIRIGKSEPRVIPLTIQAGVQTAQYIELQNVPTTGGLDIRSDPPGAKVTIDGQNRGTSPVTIRDLPPGDHDVVLEANGRKITQSVRIEAGTTAQLVVPMPRR